MPRRNHPRTGWVIMPPRTLSSAMYSASRRTDRQRGGPAWVLLAPALQQIRFPRYSLIGSYRFSGDKADFMFGRWLRSFRTRKRSFLPAGRWPVSSASWWPQTRYARSHPTTASSILAQRYCLLITRISWCTLITSSLRGNSRLFRNLMWPSRHIPGFSGIVETTALMTISA